MRPPSYVVVGHLARDLVPGGWRPGGTATYAALTAKQLGEQVAVVTSAGEDFPFATTLPGIAVANCPAPSTTSFENVVSRGRRHQRLHDRAGDLGPDAVPPLWRQARYLHLAPIANEVLPDILAIFPKALSCITAQGWLRRWDARGRVSRNDWVNSADVLARASVTIVSAEDLGNDSSTVDSFAAAARLLVVTRGAAGATVYREGIARNVPAFPVTQQGDAIGAGDVFAAAYLIALGRGGDPFGAARFANCAASFVVEQPGIEGIPSAEGIARRLAEE